MEIKDNLSLMKKIQDLESDILYACESNPHLTSAMVMLLRAVRSGLEHDDDTQHYRSPYIHNNSLAVMVNSIHCAHNSLNSYVSEKGEGKDMMLKMMKAYYDLRFTTLDHMPGEVSDPFPFT